MSADTQMCFLGATAIIASPAMRQTMDLVEKVARTSAAVLVYGETGSGKEIVARAIHHFSLPLKVLPDDPRPPLNLHLTIESLKPGVVHLSARATKDDKPCKALSCDAGPLWSGGANFDADGRASFPFWDRTLVLTRADGDKVTAKFEPRADGKGWLDLPPLEPGQ